MTPMEFAAWAAVILTAANAMEHLWERVRRTREGVAPSDTNGQS